MVIHILQIQMCLSIQSLPGHACSRSDGPTFSNFRPLLSYSDVVSSAAVIRVVTQRFSSSNGLLKPEPHLFPQISQSQHHSHIPESVAPRLIVQSQLELYRLRRHLFNYVMSLTIIMLQRFAMEHHESRLREPEHFIRDENKCTVIYLCP